MLLGTVLLCPEAKEPFYQPVKDLMLTWLLLSPLEVWGPFRGHKLEAGASGLASIAFKNNLSEFGGE